MVAAARPQEATPHGASDAPKLISQSNLQRLWAQLARHEFLEYDDWEKIVTLWFVFPDKRKQALDLIRWARAGRIRVKPDSDPDSPEYVLACAPWDSDVGPEYPVWAVSGLADRLKFMTLDQIGDDVDSLRQSGLGLDVQGYRASMFRAFPLDAEDLHEGAFIRGAKPGKPITVTGNPGDGKTDFVMNYIAAPALRAGWVVVCNIRVNVPPANYVYVKTFAEALAAAIGARLKGNRVMLIRDEGNTNRARQAATSRVAINQKTQTLVVNRKLDICEVYVCQLPTDLPWEIARTRDRWFHKISHEKVECFTPTLRGIVIGVQTTKKLAETGRPCLEFDTRDFSPYKIDADIVAIFEHEFGRRDVPWEVHVGAIKERLDRILEGPLIRDPLTLQQLKARVLKNHLFDTRAAVTFYFRFFHDDWLHNGVANTKVLHHLMKNEWGAWSHPETIGKVCRYCLEHHPTLRLEAARASAAAPPVDDESP